MFERPARPADRFPSPFPNEQAARGRNGGGTARLLGAGQGAHYERGFPWFVVRHAFTQYPGAGRRLHPRAADTATRKPPAGREGAGGKYYNTYFPGHVIAMPKPLSDGQVEYPKTRTAAAGPRRSTSTRKDVSAFLMWAAEPHLEAAQGDGFKVMIFLLVFAGLLYFTKKRIWSRVDGHAHA